MARMRKRFNSKARNSNGKTDTQRIANSKEEVKIDVEVQDDKYDSCNALVLPSAKSKVKVAQKVNNSPKILSKKQRKKLEKVLEKKKRKFNRTELLERLSRVQARPEDLKLLTPTSTAHTVNPKSLNKPKRKVSNIAGARKRAKLDVVSCAEDECTSESDDDDDDVGREASPESGVQNGGTDTQGSSNDRNSVELSAPDQATKQAAPAEEPVAAPSAGREVAGAEPMGKTMDEPLAQSPVPAVYVRVQRSPEIQAARAQLPIYCEEQLLIEAVRANPVVLIHGETGSGKTTQVPQFLYEAGFTQNNKMIAVTEPRRIAAMTMAARVGVELNAPQKVGYHIRYERTVGRETEIKFMTDGVLLKELGQDFFLSKYSVIIIDEAHERSVFSDVLIGLLSRIIRMREKKKDPLKLIIMSATIRVEDFTKNSRLFKTEPFLIRLESRQHKVQIHFNIRTPDDYLEAAYKKVCKIHRQLPSGAILVFVTGEHEIRSLCKLLRGSFPHKGEQLQQGEEDRVPEPQVEPRSKKRKRRRPAEGECGDPFVSLPDIDLDSYPVEPFSGEDLMHHLSDGEDGSQTCVRTTENFPECPPLHVLPLYSVLPFEEQQKVFELPPPGTRLCVVATNVAETSITIPGLKYVVDTGKVKTKVYSSGGGGGVSKFEVVWCSKASANQRAGRCGRTEGGHCYRLYSSAVFDNDFPDFSLPEIQTIPVDDILLQMKALGIERVVEFPFPSPPDQEALKAAERRLILLGALQQPTDEDKVSKKSEFCGRVTPLGRAMSRFPLSPRFAKMLLLSHKHHCVQYMVAVVSALTVPNLFAATASATENEEGEEQVTLINEGIKMIGAGTGPREAMLGDVMLLLRTVALYENAKNRAKFCSKYTVRQKAMMEVHKMSHQLLKDVRQAFPSASIPPDMKMDAPDPDTVDRIRKIVASCLMDRVARRITRCNAKEDKEMKNAYQCLELDAPVFIHPSSVLFDRLPQYIVYTEMFQTTKLYMKGVVEIESEWLPSFAPTFCEFSAPLEDPPPEYDPEADRILCSMEGTFGPWAWQLPVVRREMPCGFLRYCWFCFFLLDGRVFSPLRQWRGCLLSQPCVLLKSWARLLPRTKFLLEAVIGKKVDSRRALKEVWDTDPKFLLREFWEWLPPHKHLEVELQWPPIEKQQST